jgi:hypothetical protein
MDFSAFSDAAFWGALLSIIVANILLSGDNAVVIAYNQEIIFSNYHKASLSMQNLNEAEILQYLAFDAVVRRRKVENFCSYFNS